jgi:hypothetical protein
VKFKYVQTFFALKRNGGGSNTINGIKRSSPYTHHESVWKSGGIAPCLYNFSTILISVICFMSQTLYPQENSFWSQFNKRLWANMDISKRGKSPALLEIE